jgi:chromodomain-helicase-DNA-binding protein 7
MTKEEVERLLRHGAYDIFNEEKGGSSEAESKDFIEQDIDWILARRSRVVVHENTGSKSTAAGGTFSKASFKAAKNNPGNQSSADTEEVDIDDPDFWKKMVGEAKTEKQNDLSGKKRKRKKANYSESEYAKQFHASIRGDGFIEDIEVEEDVAYNSDSNSNSSDDEVESDSQMQMIEDKNCERSHWGGKGPLHWEKADVEKLIVFLLTYGYKNIATQLMLKKLDFESDEYDQEEVSHENEAR